MTEETQASPLVQIDLLDRSTIEFSEPDRDTWGTSALLMIELIRRWGKFDLDVAAAKETAKASLFYTIETNGLAQPWNGRWFCNPPWSLILPWVQKALMELSDNPKSDHGVFVLPSRTGTEWYRLLKMLEAQGMAKIIEGEGRLPFVAPPGAQESSNMEDIIIVPCWPGFLKMPAYKERATKRTPRRSQIKEAEAICQKVIAGALTPDQALEQMLMLGLTREKAIEIATKTVRQLGPGYIDSVMK